MSLRKAAIALADISLPSRQLVAMRKAIKGEVGNNRIPGIPVFAVDRIWSVTSPVGEFFTNDPRRLDSSSPGFAANKKRLTTRAIRLWRLDKLAAAAVGLIKVSIDSAQRDALQAALPPSHQERTKGEMVDWVFMLMGGIGDRSKLLTRTLRQLRADVVRLIRAGGCHHAYGE